MREGDLGRVGYLTIFAMVVGIHLWLLRTAVRERPVVAKPDAKVYRITLSRVVAKKPPPPAIPPSPEIAPVVPPQPKVKSPIPVKHPKRHKKVRKRSKPKKVKAAPPKPAPVTPPPKVVSQRAPVEQVERASIKARYIALIRQKIRENLHYPRLAKRMHMEGEVQVAFVVLADGTIRRVEVGASRHAVLVRGAKQTMQHLHLPPIPKALGEKELALSIPIAFKLK